MRKLVLLFGIAFVSLGYSPVTHAAPYGGGVYGDCLYQVECPAAPVVLPPPEVTPDPDNPSDPNIVETDVDQDGNPEQFINTDNNLDNGYEEFNDPDGSTEVLAAFTDQDGVNNFILDTNSDGEPDVFINPSEPHNSTVAVAEDGQGTAWVYVDENGVEHKYYIRQNTATGTPPVPSSTINDSDNSSPHRLTSDNFGGAAYQSIGRLALKLPQPVAYGIPYFLLLLIGILVLRFGLQAGHEIKRVGVIATTVEREKQLAFEKHNFMMLSSHYLRTPITVVRGNIELAASLKTLPETLANQLAAMMSGIQEKVGGVLKQLEENQGLAQISQPSGRNPVKSALSPFVLGPPIVIFLLMAFTHFVLIDFRVTSPSVIDFLVQITIGVLLVQLLFSKYRSHQLNKQNRLDQETLLEKQRSLDTARSNLIESAAQELTSSIQQFETALQEAAATGTDVSKIQKGFTNLKNVTNKFVFATKLQAHTLKADKQQFNIDEVVGQAVTKQQTKATEKQVQIHAQPSGVMLVQNRALFGIVVDSVLDNAVKFSDPNEAVTLQVNSNEQGSVVTVEDTGKGLSHDQLESLFKPFSRAESAEVFNTEGLGFSLYLDRLIMHYLGGEIELESQAGKGTRVNLNLPLIT